MLLKDINPSFSGHVSVMHPMVMLTHAEFLQRHALSLAVHVPPLLLVLEVRQLIAQAGN